MVSLQQKRVHWIAIKAICARVWSLTDILNHLLLWYYQVFLLLQTHLTPCTFPSTIQSYHSRRIIKEPFLFRAEPMQWHRTDHLPLQRNKVPSWNYPWISYTWQNIAAKRKKNVTSVQSPLSPMSKMAGQLSLHQRNALASFCYCIKQHKFFVLLSSSPNCAFLLDGWFHLLRSRGLWSNGSHRHCYKLQLVYLCVSLYIYVCMAMLLYWWVFTRTVQAVNRHRLYANERFR